MKTSEGHWARIQGKSMFPTLREGSRVQVERVPAHELKPGDLVVFGQESRTCHRLIKKVVVFGEEFFIHKGDNASRGGIFRKNDLCGKVVRATDANGRMLESFGSPGKDAGRVRTLLLHLYAFLFFVKSRFKKSSGRISSGRANALFWSLKGLRSAETKSSPEASQ